jgi:hypothetical protein
MSDTLMRVLPLAGRGYCCSQILGLLALEAQGRDNPDLVRALGGLCHGQGGGTCGILTGGACVLALYLGKGADQEEPVERADLVQAEFLDWFRGRVEGQYGGITCAAILGEEGGKPDVSRCGDLLAGAWDCILGLLTAQGLDPSLPRSV